MGEVAVKLQSEVDLGVCIARDLNFEDQRKLSIGKTNKMVGAIRRSFQFFDSYTFVKLYKS